MKKKLFLIFSSIGLFITIVMSLIIYFYNYNTAYEKTVQQNTALVTAISNNVDNYLVQISDMAKTIATSPKVKEALKMRNADLAQMDETERENLIDALNEQWMAIDDADNPFIKPYLTNDAALFLKDQKLTVPGLYGELFITNKYGELLASTNKLTTLAHAHKYWWQASYNDGKGRVFFDDRGYDESVEGYVLGVVVPVYDEDEIIGILKCNVNIMSFLEQVTTAYHDMLEPGLLRIARTDGTIVYEPGKEPLSNVLDESYRLDISDSMAYEINNDELVALSALHITEGTDEFGFGGSYESIDHIKGNTGQSWVMLYNAPKSIVRSSIYNIIWNLLIIDIVIVAMLIALTLFVAAHITRPIKLLETHMNKVGLGNFDDKIEIKTNDEIETLADTFNMMTANLKQTTASKQALEAEIERRTQVENEHTALLAQLSEQQKLDAISTLTRGIAHEINNPINGIMNYAQIIKDNLDKNNDNYQFADEISAESKRIAELIRSLLFFSNEESTDYTLSQMDTIIANTLSLVKPVLNRDNIALSVDVANNLPQIHCQRQQIQQVILNIIQNAIESLNQRYSGKDKNKKMDIHCKAIVQEEKQWLQLTIEDFGVGISEDNQSQIFEPFYTSKTRAFARGLGLSVSYGIIKDHGGTISVRSKEKQFTLFTIMLPAYKK